MGQDELATKAAEETVIRVTRALQINPADSRAMVLGAMAQHRIGNTQLALELVEKAYALDPESASTAYNSACLFASIGDTDRALDLIEVAIGLGNSNKRYFETDPDFKPLQDHPRFKELLSRI